MTKAEIIRVVTEQRLFFTSGATRDYSVRHEALSKLKNAIKNFEAEIHAALMADLGKPEFEAYFTETGFCQHELTENSQGLKCERQNRTNPPVRGKEHCTNGLQSLQSIKRPNFES